MNSNFRAIRDLINKTQRLIDFFIMKMHPPLKLDWPILYVWKHDNFVLIWLDNNTVVSRRHQIIIQRAYDDEVRYYLW